MAQKILISHRGNFGGPNPDRENTREYLQEAIDCGFDIECDIWYKDKSFWLGHDGPREKVDPYWLMNHQVWAHCKDIETLYQYSLFCGFQSKSNYPKYFFHQQDFCTLTSNKLIWTYPGQLLTSLSIAVKPEDVQGEWSNIDKCAGVCSDFIERYI